MKTMKMIIPIVAFIVIFFYLAETKIQLSPLKISVGNISSALAWLFLCLAIVFMTYSVHSRAYEKGLKRGSEIAREAAIEAVKQIIEEDDNHEGNRPCK